MPPALRTLLWLNFRAAFRKTTRQLRTARGIIFFLIGICVLGVWMTLIFFGNSQRRNDPSVAMEVAPAAILLFAVMNLFAAAGERAVTFTPAEVDFLFPGPFTRRQLLVYKLAKTGLGTLISALIFGVVIGRHGGTYFCRVIGIWLTFQFFQLLAMVIALLQTTIGERLVTAGRRLLLLTLGGAIALGVMEVMRAHPQFSPEVLKQVIHTQVGRIVLAPFDIFAHALLAPRFLFDGLKWSAAAMAIDLVMAGIVIGLDANYLETSAAVSARRYDRLARVRRSGISGLAKPGSATRKIPLLPWLAGAGPLIWRQLSIALRTARTLVLILIALAMGAGILIAQTKEPGESIGFIVGASVYLNLFLSQMLKFDFRGDLDHMDLLRSLPIGPTAVAAAELATPALILSMVEVVMLSTVAIADASSPAVNLFTVAAFALPFNCLVLGIDNLTFLLFPFRPKTAVAGDMTLIGRQSIVFACRLILILLVAGVCVTVGGVVWYVTGKSIPLGAIAAWFPLAISIALVIWLIGLAYNRFDPSVSTPT
jgi:hypothetical protein